jgi:outer membrane protein
VKNLSLALNGILLLAVGGLYYFHFSGSTPSGSQAKMGSVRKDSAAGPAIKPSDLKASDIVFVNLDTINARFGMIVDNSKILQKKQTALENEYQQMNEKFQRDYEESGKAAQSGQLSGAALEEVKGKLQKEQNELQMKQEQLRSVETDAQRKLAEVQKKLYDFLSRYNSSGHYRFILPFSGSMVSPVLYGKPDLDITTDVLKGLNEEYNASKPIK